MVPFTPSVPLHVYYCKYLFVISSCFFVGSLRVAASTGTISSCLVVSQKKNWTTNMSDIQVIFYSCRVFCFVISCKNCFLFAEKNSEVANPCPIWNTASTATGIVWTWTSRRKTGRTWSHLLKGVKYRWRHLTMTRALMFEESEDGGKFWSNLCDVTNEWPISYFACFFNSISGHYSIINWHLPITWAQISPRIYSRHLVIRHIR